MENMELNLNEMTEVTGGKGGSKNVLIAKKGYRVYQIQSGDTLTRIAKNFKCTVDDLMAANAGLIKDRDDISTGYYIYVPD